MQNNSDLYQATYLSSGTLYKLTGTMDLNLAPSCKLEHWEGSGGGKKVAKVYYVVDRQSRLDTIKKLFSRFG